MIELEEKLQIIDSFRYKNTERRRYTFTSADKKVKSRVDRIYISIDDVGKIQATNFESTDLSDHNIVRLRMARNVEKGPGQWIFNNSILKEKEFTDEIKIIINEFVDNANKFPNAMITWDFLKMNMESEAKNYTQIRARRRREKIENIQRKLETLEAMPREQIGDYTIQRINELKEQEIEFHNEKVKGSVLR